MPKTMVAIVSQIIIHPVIWNAAHDLEKVIKYFCGSSC